MAHLVTVIVPALNAERFLAQTVQSVMQQTYRDWELTLVVDPLCQDHTSRVARECAGVDKRIRVHKAGTPGVSGARNYGLAHSEGRYVAFLDSDDVWMPSKLEIQLKQMETTGAAISCTAFRRMAEDGKHLGHQISVPERITRERLLQANCILCSSVMLDRSKIKKDIRFPEVGCEDFALWLQLMREIPLVLGINQDLVHYRQVKGSRGANKWKSIAETWSVYRDQEKLSLPKASALMVPFLARNVLKYSRF